MFNLQGSEIIVILLLALVVLGPDKLPDAIRRFAQTYAELKKMGTGFQSELKNALDEPMREMRATADLVMNAADPQKLAEQAEAEVAARVAADAADDDVEIDERAYLVNDPAFEKHAASETRDADSGEPVNQIAVANSSAALSAASASRAADTVGDAAAEPDDREPDDREPDDREPDHRGTDAVGASGGPPPGPAFHSAAPRGATPVSGNGGPAVAATGDGDAAGPTGDVTEELPADVAASVPADETADTTEEANAT